MKQISLAIAVMATVVLSSCNNSETSSTMASDSKDSTGNSMDQQNLEKNRSMYTAIQKGDSATIRSMIADDAVDHQSPNGQEVKGVDSITHMLSDIHNHVKDMKFDVVADAIKGDYIFAMVDMKGTATDNTMGMPAGSKMDGKTVDVVKVKDGKMVEHWGFMDWQDVMKMSSQPPMNSAPKKK
jgi:predicted ester cyclase